MVSVQCSATYKEKKMNINTDLTTFTKINSKWIRGLTVKCKTMKNSKDNIGENLEDPGYGNVFF